MVIIVCRVSSRNFTSGGKFTNCVAIGHGEGGVCPLLHRAQKKILLIFGGLILANANTEGDFFLG